MTRSEKRVLAELCKTELKLSYKDLAVTLEVSPNTAKNHMCHIRNKGFPIKEYDDAKGVKRFYVPDNMKKILLSKNV
ncbi:MAG: helix-turn-helix transcriptional regulator [Candidatus Woesearchaeota archaeon]